MGWRRVPEESQGPATDKGRVVAETYVCDASKSDQANESTHNESLGINAEKPILWENDRDSRAMKIARRKSVRWFLAAGFVGLVAALLIAILRPANPIIILLFWPTSIVGLADPTGFVDQALTAVVEFGGNFVLYGAFGAAAGAASDRIQG